MNRVFRWIYLGILPLLLAGNVQAQEDDHDKLVYGRYSRKVEPSKIQYPTEPFAKLKHDELAHPATKEDVEQGKAVFTFAGLGESRVWKLPKCPQFCHWPELKEFPFSYEEGGETNYENYGDVIQAEELLVGGKWKRYYGFVCKHGAAVVPAVNIDFSLGDPQPLSYEEMGGGLDWGVLGPGYRSEAGRATRIALKPSEPLLVEIHIRNRRGVEQEVPTVFYHTAKDGGPAFLQGVKVSLSWAPFDPRNPDKNYPLPTGYRPQTLLRSNSFPPGGSKRLLKTGESFQAFTFDLHDWFKIEEPGYYTFKFFFDAKEMGIAEETFKPNHYVVHSFRIGDPPRRLSVAELNQGIEPFGSQENQERIVKLIKETIRQTVQKRKVDPAEEAEQMPWSKPVNGLAARIENLGRGSYAGFTVLVRLKNVSQQSITVPAGNPSDTQVDRHFELYTQRLGGEWQRTAWFPGEKFARKGEKVDQGGTIYNAELSGNRNDRPAFVLKPGENCLAYLCGAEESDKVDEKKMAAKMKIVLRLADSQLKDGWHGVLETPSFPAYPPVVKDSPLAGSQPFPEHFPLLVHLPFGDGNSLLHISGNGPPNESQVSQLWSANRELITALELYDPVGVSKEFEHLMLVEKDPAMKLLLATLAAKNGSEVAGLFLLESRKKTDYSTVRNINEALRIVLSGYENDPPDWIRELVQSALADERYVTESKKSNRSSDTYQQIAYLADEYDNLTLALGYSHCHKAVLFLIEMAKRTKGARGPIMALGDIGDVRAIPILLHFLKEAGSVENYSDGSGLSDKFSRPLHALANLKSKEAIPTLLEYVEFPEVIEALEQIGDLQVLPVMQELIASKGKLVKDGKRLYPKLEQGRFFAARLAVASLAPGDAVPRLGDMLADQSLSEFQRREVVWRLGDRRDQRAVPYLIKAVKTDPSGAVANQAIRVLALFKSKAAVVGLIECFDTDFTGERDWKRAYTPAMFRENIAASLRAITGESIGPDKEQWQKWWHEKGNTGKMK